MPSDLKRFQSFNQDDELGSESYDSNGSVTAAQGKTFSYDTENHLVSMNSGAVQIVYEGVPSDRSSSLGRDGDGNRVKKIVGGVTTTYLVDDLNPTGYPQVVEELTNGAVSRTYTYGLQRISEAQSINGTWTPSFYGYDGLGTVRQLTDSTGHITDSYDYDAYGNKINSTGTTPNNYLYRGEQYDSDLSLYYLRARYYNPAIGRFISEDPIGLRGGLNNYVYADNSPLDEIDLFGLSGCVTRQQIIDEAQKWNGTPYGHGLQKIGVRGDCSGTVQQIYSNLGMTIKLGAMPSGSAAQGINNSPSLFHTSNPQPGDIVYWNQPSNHTMIYAGGGYAWGARTFGKTFGYWPMKWFGNDPVYLTSALICP